jgi:pyridoxine 5-phosphate synthase
MFISIRLLKNLILKMGTKLSVNINKIALIRNSRGQNQPNLTKVAQDCERFGAQGITVHPRPDQRHIRYDDIAPLMSVNTTEFNIEGYPSPDFMELVLQHRPAQATLVPDPPGVLTSNEGWDTIQNADFLKDIIAELQSKKIRVSLFVDPIEKLVDGAAKVGADRIEFYTGKYANDFFQDKNKAIAPHIAAAKVARASGLGINAGHDLSLDNLRFYAERIEGLLEVSIGHALVCDALYFGLQNTIQMYLNQLRTN